MTSDRDILEFWLGPEARRDDPGSEVSARWFEKSDAFDALVAERFGADVERAARGEYSEWASDPRGRLALIVLFDQFTRNIHRGSGRMFENDPRALALAQASVDSGEHRALRGAERQFTYMPFMHAESLPAQQLSCELFAALERDHPHIAVSQWAVRHMEIVRDFGRFPHRNELLGRVSTPQELEFLAKPGSSF